MDNSAPSSSTLLELYSRPGFLLRRAHQISVAVFLEETQALNVTATQYGALYAVRHVPGLDQIGLARVLGIDRSTSALVVTKLESAGWIVRETDDQDRRRKVLVLTPAGLSVLDRLATPARQGRERLMNAFTPEEGRQFLALLGKFSAAFNEQIRTPLIPPGG